MTAAVAPARTRLPRERQGITHAFEVGALLGVITANVDKHGKVREVFIAADRPGDSMRGLLDAVAICTSVALQHGIALDVIASKFIGARFEPAGFTTNKAIPRATSPLDYIFRWLLALEERAAAA